jgi:hypothetical protein
MLGWRALESRLQALTGLVDIDEQTGRRFVELAVRHGIVT